MASRNVATPPPSSAITSSAGTRFVRPSAKPTKAASFTSPMPMPTPPVKSAGTSSTPPATSPPTTTFARFVSGIVAPMTIAPTIAG